MRIRNIDQVRRKIEAAAKAGGEAMVSGLRVIGEEIRTDVAASRPGAGVPLDQGPLRASLRVQGPEKRGTVDVVQLVAGGAAAPYALRQHEELQYKHDDGEARYWIRGLERWQRGGTPEQALKEMLDAAVAAAKRA
jgi:hypothetical protein